MSVKIGGYSFETLQQRIYAGSTQIKKIYAGSTLIYPTKAGRLKCYIDRYPKSEYYTGETFNWDLLIIMAEDEYGNRTDVTQNFTITPLEDSHCKQIGSFLGKCVWATEDETYTLYFPLLGKPRRDCWIERKPHLLYVRKQPIDWSRLLIYGSDINGTITDVTDLFTANPKHGSLANTRTGDDYILGIDRKSASFTGKVDGQTYNFSLTYKVSPDHLFKVEDIVGYSGNMPSDVDEKSRLGKFLALVPPVGADQIAIIELTRSPLTSTPRNYLWIYKTYVEHNIDTNVRRYRPYYILRGFKDWTLSMFYDENLDPMEVEYVVFVNPPGTNKVDTSGGFTTRFKTSGVAGTTTYYQFAYNDSSLRTTAILPNYND